VEFPVGTEADGASRVKVIERNASQNDVGLDKSMLIASRIEAQADDATILVCLVAVVQKDQ